MLLAPLTSRLFPYTTLFRSGDVARFEAGFGRKQLRRIGLGAARPAVVEQPRRLEAHGLRGLELGPRHRERVRDRLVLADRPVEDRKSTRLNSSHLVISYAVF